jgi:hypothetical protein
MGHTTQFYSQYSLRVFGGFTQSLVLRLDHDVYSRHILVPHRVYSLESGTDIWLNDGCWAVRMEAASRGKREIMAG